MPATEQLEPVRIGAYGHIVCECGCRHCPTVVWDIEDQPERDNGEFVGWLRANAINPMACAGTPIKVIRHPTGEHSIMWQEIMAGPNEGERPNDPAAVWPRGVAHEWGEPEKVKIRRLTNLTVPPPGLHIAGGAR